MTATRETITLREVTGLPTTTRVFAAYVNGLNAGFLTADAERNTIALVYVADVLRRHGIATALLRYAREATGLSLDQDTGERTLAGSRWAGSQGLKIAEGHGYKRIGDRDIAKQIAVLGMALFYEPEEET